MIIYLPPGDNCHAFVCLKNLIVHNKPLFLLSQTCNCSREGSVRSERLLMEEMDYNILFRWFVGLNLDDLMWDATVFTENRNRLLEAEVAKENIKRRFAGPPCVPKQTDSARPSWLHY
jgi:hypothetical protein